MTEPLRIPPHDKVAEVSVLGMAMIYPETLVDARERIAATDFYGLGHVAMFSMLCELADANRPADAHGLFQEIDKGRHKELGFPDVNGAKDYVVDVQDSVPAGTGNLHYYCRVLRDKARLRQAASTAEAFLGKAFSPAAEPDETLRAFQDELFAITCNEGQGATTTLDVAAQRVLRHSQAVEQGEVPAGLITGFPRLDGLTSGLKGGQLIVLAGATSVGKSALAGQFAMNIAKNTKVVQFFAAEMTADEMATRMLSILSGVNGLKIANGRQSPADWGKTTDALADIRRFGKEFSITDQPMIAPRMEQEVRRTELRLRKKVDLTIIDYLQIVPTGPERTTREQINAITGHCKQMAKRLACPVVLLSQLNRTHLYERRPPELADLKESSNIEQDADIVLLLYRPQADNDPDTLSGAYEVMLRVAKNRTGMTSTWHRDDALRMRFLPSCTSFVEMNPRVTEQAIG